MVWWECYKTNYKHADSYNIHGEYENNEKRSEISELIFLEFMGAKRVA